jgi:hypothetical protein
MYTLGLPGSKTYVSNTLNLMTLIQRNSKILSFDPFTVLTSKKMADASEYVVHQLSTNLVQVHHKSMRDSLQIPSSENDQMNARMASEAALHVDKMVSRATEMGEDGTTSSKQVMLLDWVRHLVVQASSCGVYGQEHPFRDPEVETAFW